MKKIENIVFAVICVGIVGWFVWQNVDRNRKARAWEQDLHQRLLTDFRRSREEVTGYIRRYIPDVTEARIDEWTATQKLENMELDGEIRYFRNAGPNLFRIDPACAALKAGVEEASLSGNALDGHQADDADNIPRIVAEVRSKLADGRAEPYIAQPRRYRVTYTLTVDADAVPAGETVRCWLPYPRRDLERQKDVVFISASEPEYVIAPVDEPHSTLYMEKKAVAGEPTVFTEEFAFTSYGEWHPIDPAAVRPYQENSAGYQYYTRQRERHVRFSKRLHELADSLTAGIDNPYLQARAIYTWIDRTFPWASAREYSTVDNIPEYVLDSGHGDCGMVTLLLVTLCRIKGIPARWQSGFMMHPSGWNLHDWGELYFEGYGWVPVDQSFGIYDFLTGYEYFYFGGIDSHRFYVNSDYGQPLYPHKQYPRSETVDFQRGEVEWKGGNLYFPHWDYHMDIEYL